MASVVFEVECECEGLVFPPEPEIGIGREVGNADLSSVSMLKWVRGNPPGVGGRYDSIDLLDGLDAKSRDIVIANIMAAFPTEIDEAILSDA